MSPDKLEETSTAEQMRDVVVSSQSVRAIRICALLFSLICALQTGDARERAKPIRSDELVARAEICLSKGQLADSIAAYQEAADHDPDDRSIRLNLVKVWELAVKENPVSPENHLGLAMALQKKGEFAEAITEYQQAMRFSPDKQNKLASELLSTLSESELIYGVVDSIERALQDSWHPTSPASSTSPTATVLTVTVESDGKFGKAEISYSNNRTAEKNAILALFKSVTVPSLAGGQSLDLLVSFNSDSAKSTVVVRPLIPDLVHSTPAPHPVVPDQMSRSMTTSGIDYGPYLADLQRRVKRCWFPPPTSESNLVIVNFVVHRDGSLTDLNLGTSCGISSFDEAALNAVRLAQPFRPLPPGSKERANFSITFDCRVRDGGTKGAVK